MRPISYLAAASLSFLFFLSLPGPDDIGTSDRPAVAAAMPREQAVYLVRSTLLTLDGANRSGNYAVLHALAAPQFRQRFSTDDLAAIFAALRKQGPELAAIALAQPTIDILSRRPDGQALRIGGRFAATTGDVAFDLTFAIVGGHWRLADLSVAAAPAVSPTHLAARQQ